MEASLTPSVHLLPPLYGWKPVHIHPLLEVGEIELGVSYLFQPSSLFTRMQILGANGPIQLSIPVQKPEKNAPLSNIFIDYNQKWQNQHWRSLTSAYGKSPYFLYYESELRAMFEQQPERLVDFTLPFSLWLLQQYRKPFRKNPAKLAQSSNQPQPKTVSLSELGLSDQLPSPVVYPQVFGKEFVNFLGALDHLFCAGPRFWNFQN